MIPFDKQLKDLSRATNIARARVMAQNLRANWHLVKPETVQPGTSNLCVVGAGPSLDRVTFNGHSAIATHGAAVAAGHVQYCVYIETIDMLEQVERVDTSEWILDISAAPRVVKYCVDSGKPIHWICDSSPYAADAMESHGVECLPSGPSAATVAAAWALRHAQVVTTAGVDCCYGLDGQVYAKGTPWGDYRYAEEADVDGETCLVFHGAEEREGLHDRSEVPRIPRRRKAFRVACRDGTERWTTPELVAQYRWFRAHGLSPAPFDLEFPPAPRVDYFERSVRDARAILDGVKRDGKMDADSLMRGGSYVETLGLSDLLTAQLVGMKGVAMLRASYAIMAAAIDAVEQGDLGQDPL